MKSIGALLVSLVVLAGSTIPFNLLSKPHIDHTFKRSVELFIPVVCTSQASFRWPIGTGFKINDHMIMTAGHVDCNETFGPDAVTEISDDHGLHWVVVPIDHNFKSPAIDLRVYVMPELALHAKVRFRAGVLGEHITVYGQANGIVSGYSGVVTRADPAQTSTSVPGIGGLSGSAIVADDGSVVGIVDIARPFYVQEHFVTALAEGPSGLALQEQLVSLQTYLKAHP